MDKSNLLLKDFQLDTNVLLFDPESIYSFDEHDVTIHIQAIEELDTFKKGPETINFHAREFCRIIDGITGDNIFNGGVSLGEGKGKLRIALSKPMHEKVKENLRIHNVDAEIINLAYCLKEERKDREVIIVSKDINLRLKAKALGIKAQDYLHEKVLNVDFFSKKVETINATSEVIDELYKTKIPVAFQINEASVNQNFILKSGKQSALVRYNNGFSRLISKDSFHPFDIRPKNAEQCFAMDALLDPNITIVTIEGKAGTGKTLISLVCALEQLKEDIYDQVLFSRVTISMGDREIGFLPGDADAKIGPFMMGMQDNLNVIIAANTSNFTKIDTYKRTEKLIIEPLPYIRGRSLHRSIFILDEAQNLTPHEIKTIATRAGEGTKMVFIGDTHQIDNPYLDQSSNGFSHLINKFQGQECYSHIHLIKSERSALAELSANIL